jgi:multidrug efflux system membrane fusion protein
MDSQAKPTLNTAPPKRSRKLLGSVIAVAAMVGLGGLAWYLTHQPATPPAGAQGAGGPPGAGGPGGGRRSAATTVGVATAEKADIPVTLEALGTVTAAATTTVRPQVSGILQSVLFKEGQMVKAGQVLAQIDPRQFEMALLQASGQRQRDEAQLENAKLTLNRYRTLLTQDSIARQDVDTQAALVKQLEGTVMTDRAAEGTAKLNLGYTKVVAPISGRVGLRVVDIGNLVGSSDTGGIAVITQLSPIDVEFSIPQDSVPGVMQRVNDGAALPALALDRTRTATLDSGKFSAMDNQIDVQTGTVKAKARFANAKFGLFPSQFVNVRLELNTIKDAIMVPVTAVRHGTSGDFVYVLKADKTVTVRAVTRGQATVDKVQVSSGLQLGEQVITEGGDRLKEGAKVTLPGAGGGAGGRAHGAGGEHAGGWKGKRDAAAADGASAPASAPAAAGEGAPAPAGEHRRRNKEGAAQQ